MWTGVRIVRWADERRGTVCQWMIWRERSLLLTWSLIIVVRTSSAAVAASMSAAAAAAAGAVCGSTCRGLASAAYNSMHIGMKVSNRCSIIALVSLYPSCYPWRNCYFGRKCCVVVIWFCADWRSVEMPVSSLWQRNSTLNLMTLFALVLSVLRTAFGFIFLNWFSHYYVFLYYFVCVIVYVLFLFMLHPCVLNWWWWWW